MNDPKEIKDGDGTEEYKVIGGGENAFPLEYSVSGWFKWKPFEQIPWRFLFRLTINDKASNKDASVLGDRTLALWHGQNQFYYWTTYSYNDMHGNGNADINSGTTF